MIDTITVVAVAIGLYLAYRTGRWLQRRKPVDDFERKYRRRIVQANAKAKARQDAEDVIRKAKAKAKIEAKAAVVETPPVAPRPGRITEADRWGTCPRCGQEGRLNVYEIPPGLVLCARCDAQREIERDR